MGCAIPRQAGLGYIREIVEKARESKPVYSDPRCLCLSSCLQVPSFMSLDGL